MIKKCLTCLQESEAEPFDNHNVSHGFCSHACAEVWKEWDHSPRPRPTLRYYYLMKLADEYAGMMAL